LAAREAPFTKFCILLSFPDLTDAQERIKELAQLIGALPIANYTILRALTAHLILIVQNAHVNKMTMRNVGIVFSPTLGIPAGVFSLMLAEFNRVFNVDMDDDAAEDEGEAPSDPSAQLPEPVRRNSKRYSDQAADKLLGLSGRSLKGKPFSHLKYSATLTDPFQPLLQRRMPSLMLTSFQSTRTVGRMGMAQLNPRPRGKVLLDYSRPLIHLWLREILRRHHTLQPTEV
jgi:RhoGAP domain